MSFKKQAKYTASLTDTQSTIKYKATTIGRLCIHCKTFMKFPDPQNTEKPFGVTEGNKYGLVSSMFQTRLTICLYQLFVASVKLFAMYVNMKTKCK